MKKHLFSIVFLVLTSLTFSQSIPNGGFESWMITNYETPVFWQTSNFEKDEAVVKVNAVKTTDAYHGNYAIKLTTSAVTSGTKIAFGWYADGQPGNGPSGGIPYNQKPTGIRFHYKSNIIGTDSAIFLCFFKKNGAYIGQYLFKIGATKTAYTLYNATFSPSLSVTPDTVLIASASSNAFLQTGFQVGNSLQVDSILFKGVSSQPQNFNGDFEQWVPETNDNLNGWFLHPDFSRTTDAYSGTYALELQTKGPNLNDNRVQAATLRNFINVQYTVTTGGSPFSNQIDTLVFFYKYLPADPLDSGRVFVNFKKNNVQIGMQTWTLLPISASYKQVVMPFNVGQVPDSIMISIESSKYVNSIQGYSISFVGSDLKIDNMYLKSQKMPIGNFILPPVGCQGQPVQVTDNSANMANAWGWIMPGGTPGSSTAQNPVVVYNTLGPKVITMVCNNQFGASVPFSKTITINAIPNVGSTSTITPCGGGSAILTATGATTYTWSTGANTSTVSVSPSSTTVYTVVGTTNGCSNAAIGVVVIPGVPRPDICIVTVDSANKYNEIYWDKTAYPMLDSMLIFREVISNTYKRIGAVGKNALSMFTDTMRSIGPANGDPNISTYRYKLQMRDTCGNYGPKSLWHNTIFFTHTGSTFFWTNNYMIEGPYNPVQTYSLMVCPNPTVTNATYSLVGTTTGNQSTLNDPFYSIYAANADWRVVADLGYSCTPTFQALKGGGISIQTSGQSVTKSSSNIQNNRPQVGVKENSLKAKTKVYPNPTNGKLNVEFDYINEEVTLSMSNVLGQEVYNERTSVNKTIDVSNFSKGVYILSVSNKTNKALYKIIVD